jgi:hypothetical protein
MKNYGQGFDLLQLIDRKEFQTLCKKMGRGSVCAIFSDLEASSRARLCFEN